jgi:membrane-associated phospholipid phosphatase
VARQCTTLSVAAAARIVALGVLAYLVSKALAHVIVDPRPYIVTHTRPLIPLAHDNGFPSDHVLLAAALTASLWWIDRRWLVTFATGTTLVLLGRLGIGAHHTVDVLGSVAIAAGVGLILAVAPLPPAWNAPLLPARWRARAALLSRPRRRPVQRP